MSEIFNNFLHVPDADFADPLARFGPVFPSTPPVFQYTPYSEFQFADPYAVAQPRSNICLVSRRWCRIATPLLLRVVILRSKEQARCLVEMLAEARKRHGPLERNIRKLRIEGGFGDSLRKIMQNSNQVTDLYMAISFHSSDRVSGLCQGLRSLNPTRIVIFDSEDSKEKSNHKEVTTALCKVMQTWSRLVSGIRLFTFQYSH